MADDAIVDRMYDDFRSIVEQIGGGEISLRLVAEDNFRKNLLLAAASYFEKAITECITRMVATHSGSRDLVLELLRNKAIERQYHTYFQWKERNANAFFGMFGEGFKLHMQAVVREDGDIESSIKAFLELGNERNRLVHQDFGSYSLEKTSEEIIEAFRSARRFVDCLPAEFSRYCDSE